MFYKKDKICIFIVLLVLFYNFLNYLAICSRLLDIIITIFDKREIHIDFVSRKKDYLKSYCGWNLAVWSRIRCKILIRIKIINISFRFGYFFYLSINKVSNMFFFIFASFFPRRSGSKALALTVPLWLVLECLQYSWLHHLQL